LFLSECFETDRVSVRMQEARGRTEAFEQQHEQMCDIAMNDRTCDNDHTPASTTTNATTTTTTTTATTTNTGVGGGGLMCAPILNADGHVIAVCLLSNKLTSADEERRFSDNDEKVKGAFSAATDRHYPQTTQRFKLDLAAA